ncbi:recombinase family protein [Sporofaciens sp. SGI.106]|uniref:recombinase family protein n=1 Tax=Sporofaciens sp. SGI.106 TaxID=3420568 RepID=UPI003D01267D
MIYGYVRVSTDKQNIDRQIRNILAVDASAKIYQEIFTGTKTTGRHEFQKLLNKVQSGDTIIFDSVSRMSRNAAEGFELYKKLFDDGVNLVFINEPYINTDVYKATRDALVPMTNTDVDLILAGVNQYLMKLAEKQVELAFEQAQKERDDLSERTKQGLQTAKLNGKQLGRAKGTVVVTKKSDESKKKMLQHAKTFGGTLTDVEMIKLLGIDKNTYYKYKKELKNARLCDNMRL